MGAREQDALARRIARARAEGTVPARLRVAMTPGQMLRTLRELQELSQVELAKASGVSQPAISAVEGGAPLGVERAKKLAAALEVHPAILLFPDWEPAEVAPLAKARTKAAAKPKARAVHRRKRTA